MPATIFQGSKVKALKAALQLSTFATIHSGNLDPSSSGFTGALGDAYISTLTYGIYLKTGAGATAWSKAPTASGLTLKSVPFADSSGNLAQDNANFNFDDTTNVLTVYSVTVPNTLNADGGIQRSSAGTLAIGTSANSSTINIGHAGATVNIQGTTVYENTTTLQVVDPLITINKGGGVGSGSNSGIEIEENALITGYAETSADRNSWILKAPATAGVATITPGAGGITLSQSSHDSVTLGAVGATPNANAASLSSQVLTLQPADGTNPGVLTSGVQTIGGNKTFSGTISASNLSGTNTGDITLTAVGAVPNANAASLSGQALTLQPADGTNPGVVTIAAQTLAGAKTFSTAPILSSLTASLPLKLDASKNITAAAIDLASAEVTNALPETKGGTNQSTYTLGDTLYASAANTLSKLAGNTTTTKKFLTQTGDGVNSAAPGWNTLVIGDMPAGSTFTEDATFSLKAGTSALLDNTTSQYNIAIGNHAAENILGSGTSGDNIAIGRNALLGASTFTANNNIAIGLNAFAGATTATNSIAIGINALDAGTTSSNTVAIGSNAGGAITTGGQITAIGSGALQTISTNSNSTAVGYTSLNVATGQLNTAIGTQSGLAISTGQGNTALGADSLLNQTVADFTTAVGHRAQNRMKPGAGTSGNTSVGYNSLLGSATPANNTGIDNTAVGSSTGVVLTSADRCSMLGAGVFSGLSTGDDNTGIGYAAGTNTNSLTTGSSNTFLGSQTGIGSAGAVGFSNMTVIGANALVSTANTVVIGRTTDTVVHGATGIDAASTAITQLTGSLSKLGISTKTGTSYTAVISDDYLIIDATAGAYTVTLYSAAISKGKELVIKKKDSSVNAVTINTVSSQNIDGGTSYVINTQYNSVTLVSDGTQFWII